MKSFNELKRDLKDNIGGTLKVLYHFRANEDMMQDRKIEKVQSNAIVTSFGTHKACWLYYPKSASLVEYNDNIFTIYEAGERDLTEAEKNHLEAMANLTTPEEKELDLLTDGSTDFWRREAYAREHKVEYLRGFEEVRGLKYNRNTGKVRDNKIKGEKLYTFQIAWLENRKG